MEGSSHSASGGQLLMDAALARGAISPVVALIFYRESSTPRNRQPRPATSHNEVELQAKVPTSFRFAPADFHRVIGSQAKFPLRRVFGTRKDICGEKGLFSAVRRVRDAYLLQYLHVRSFSRFSCSIRLHKITPGTAETLSAPSFFWGV